jgi:hypothetical protein
MAEADKKSGVVEAVGQATGGPRIVAAVGQAHRSRAPLPAPATGEPMPPPERRKAGAKPKYAWDVIQARCYRAFGDNGYPDNVSAFCQNEIIPWCEKRWGVDGTPDTETLRPLVTKWIDAWNRSLDPR